ncbi:MAG TPA: hypothetical protein VKE74_29940 [Gemmataceae bacterium]|nr:hypothetical protein [Gemmataceae bacterium]
MSTIAGNPAAVLTTLAEHALVLCRADSTGVSVLEPGGGTLDAAMRAFRELHPATQTLVSADANSYRKEVWVRILHNGRPDMDRNGQIEVSLARSLDSPRAVAERNRGGVHHRGGNDYMDVWLR